MTHLLVRVCVRIRFNCLLVISLNAIHSSVVCILVHDLPSATRKRYTQERSIESFEISQSSKSLATSSCRLVAIESCHHGQECVVARLSKPGHLHPIVTKYICITFRPAGFSQSFDIVIPCYHTGSWGLITTAWSVLKTASLILSLIPLAMFTETVNSGKTHP